MEIFSRYYSQIKTQLAGLTLSQRMLIGMLILVMLGTVFFVVQYSKKPEMVELLAQPLKQDEIVAITSNLKGKYQYEISGDRIMVPLEQAYLIRGELAAAQALPKDTTQAFLKLMDQSEFLMTDSSANRRWDIARQEVLSRVIRAFPYIADATVILSKGERPGLGREAVPSSATVSVKLKNGEGLTSNQVMSIVETIRGAVSGLTRENVHVTDGLRAYTAPSEGLLMPSSLLELKRSYEDDLTRKLFATLSHFGDVKIAVNVVPDMSSQQSTSEKYDPAVKAVVSETSKDMSSNEGSNSNGQPGVVPNGIANTGTGTTSGTRSSSTNTISESKSDVRFGRNTLAKTIMPGTEIKKMSASISLPRSYFVHIFQQNKKDPKAEPDDSQLTEIIKDNLDKAQKLAINAIGAETPDQVRVDWFYDTMLTRAEPVSTSGSSNLLAGGAGGLLSQYAKQVVLGTVAFGALMMMLMMIRKAAPSAAGVDADPGVFFSSSPGDKPGRKKKKGDPGALDVEDDVIGEAGQGEAVLTGIELDDETLRSRKMVDEVSVMIRENPENAAALVKRWLAKGK